MSTMLHVGDPVLWRGSWGRDPALPAKIESIEIVETGKTEGTLVPLAPWEIIHNLIVSLDNGQWAYGHQLSPV